MRVVASLLSALGLCVSVAVVAGASLPAQAQPAPTPPPVDAAQEAAKRAFEALPEQDRKAMQDGLIWTGDYKGIADGRFGKGTRDAIVAFATRAKLPGDGTLDDKGRAALAAAAQRAKAIVGYSTVTDERAGVKIGVPLKLLAKIRATKTGAHYASTDGKAALETALVPESEATLEQKFDALRAETAQRKVTYKVQRPEFIVVVGEAAGTIFYTRYTRVERAGEKMLASYTLTYPAAAKATYDMIAIAAANSFEPLGGAAPVVATTPTPTTPSVTAPTTPLTAPGDHAAEAAPGKPTLAANGVVVAPGLVVTSLPGKCSGVQIGGHAAKIVQQEKGLALIEAAGLKGPAPALRGGDVTADLAVVALAFAPSGAREDLVAAPGLLRATPAGPRVQTSAQGVRAGSAVFDRAGTLVGVIAADSGQQKRVGDVEPMASLPLISAATLGDFLGAKKPKIIDASATAERSVGDIVAEDRAAMVAIYCVP